MSDLQLSVIQCSHDFQFFFLYSENQMLSTHRLLFHNIFKAPRLWEVTLIRGLVNETNGIIKKYELKLLALSYQLSKLSNSKIIQYNMLHLLRKHFFQNRLNCGKMKQNISKPKNQGYFQFLQAYCFKKTQGHNPISSHPVIENSPVVS